MSGDHTRKSYDEQKGRSRPIFEAHFSKLLEMVSSITLDRYETQRPCKRHQTCETFGMASRAETR